MAQKEDRRLGSIIGGKWRVDRVLGTGSMATVYAVTHRNGVTAALKILHPALCSDPKVCERFLGEGYLTNAVKHPGIVRVLDDGMTDDGCVFLVMDLLEGTTLELLRQERGGKLDVDEALDIADQLMDALSAVHAAGIIHRDLKPQNVFVCHGGEVKLLDFGVARVLENAGSKNKMSLFGMVLGTPSFMSPEQAIGARDQVDHRADVYSLGATIFTALTGETVHLGPHVQAKLLAAGTVQARSIALVKQDLPAPIANVIDTALRFDKADRWQSVDAFRRALRDARRSTRTARSTFPGLGEPGSEEEGAGQAPRHVAEDAHVSGHVSGHFPPPHAGHTGAAKTLPMGIKKPLVLEEMTLDDAVEEDDSIPAVHTPVPPCDRTDPLMPQLEARRSSAGFVVASLALLAAAIGGVAFFAMGGHASSDADFPEPMAASSVRGSAPEAPTRGLEDSDATRRSGGPEATTLTSATLAKAQEDSKETDAGAAPVKAPGSSVHPPAHAAITPPATWHPRPRNASVTPVPPPNSASNPAPNPAPSTSFPRSSVTPEPPPAITPAPSANPSVSSDPFATPE